MTTNKKTFLVFNATDGFYASPDEMTKEEAETFVKQFPERFRTQGYYRTGRWEKIRPEDVELNIVSLDELKSIRKKKAQRCKGLER